MDREVRALRDQFVTIGYAKVSNPEINDDNHPLTRP